MPESNYSDKRVEMCPKICSSYENNDCYLAQREAEPNFDGTITFEEVKKGCSLESRIGVVSRLVEMNQRMEECSTSLQKSRARIPHRRSGSWSRRD